LSYTHRLENYTSSGPGFVLPPLAVITNSMQIARMTQFNSAI